MSLPSELSEQLDAMVSERGLPSRSRLLSELIRHAVVAHEETMDAEAIVSGSITVIYRVDGGRVRQQIAEKQTDYFDEIVSSQHVSIDKNESLEVFIVQGAAVRLRAFCDDLRSLKGVKQLNLVTGSASGAFADDEDFADHERRAEAA